MNDIHTPIAIPIDPTTTAEEFARRLSELPDGACALLETTDWLWDERRAAFLASLAGSKRSFILCFFAHRLPSPNGLAHLHQLGCMEFQVTLTGGCRLIADKQGGGEVFNKAREGLRRLRETGLPFSVQVPVTPINRADLEHVVEQLWALDILDAPLHFTDETGRFGREIHHALTYRDTLRQDRLPTVSHLCASKTEHAFSFSPQACPFRTGAFPTESFSRHVLLRRREQDFELFHCHSDDEVLIARTKLARERVALLHDGHLIPLRLVNECRTCPRLANCATMMEEGPASPSLPYPEPQENDGRLSFVPSALKRLGPGETLSLSGAFPWMILTDDADAALSIPMPSEPSAWARLAHALGLSVTAYELPHENRSRPWSITLLAPRAPVRDQRERLAIAQLTSLCVARCVMCSIPQYFRGASLSTPRCLRLLEEFRLAGFSAVDLFGGEITLRTDLPLLVREAKRNGLTTMLISTGWTLDEALVSTLEDAGVDRLTISLDSAEAPLHDRIKGKPGLWTRAVQAVETVLRRGRMDLEINSVILHDNWMELPALLAFTHGLGIRNHRFFFAVSTLRQFSPPRWMNAEEAGRFFTEIKPELDRFGTDHEMHLDFMPPLEPPSDAEARERFLLNMGNAVYQQQGPCFVPQEEVFITPDGEVHACLNFIGKTPPLGNIEEGSLSSILNGENAARIAEQAGFLAPCAQCFAKRNRQ